MRQQVQPGGYTVSPFKQRSLLIRRRAARGGLPGLWRGYAVTPGGAGAFREGGSCGAEAIRAGDCGPGPVLGRLTTVGNLNPTLHPAGHPLSPPFSKRWGE
jgi:hypothetical protein